LDLIQKKLNDIAAEFVHRSESRHVKMADMLVPVSMAMLTDYDADYLGIAAAKKDKE
jgi:hypothetical protein